METRSIRGLMLFYDAEEQGAAELIGAACERSMELMQGLWGLQVPKECRVYVMTSWVRFVFHSAPWPWRLWLGVTLPLRYGRIQQLWRVAGGWAQRYGQRRTVGVKPPRLLRDVDPGLRARIFVERNVDEWAQHNTCHELVHAFTDHLGLPAWLHEGLAMVTVDQFAGKPTVRAETLETLGPPSPSRPSQDGSRNSRQIESLVRLSVRGYWMTRYLADTRPDLLRSLLEHPQPQQALENELAAGLGMTPHEFSTRIDGIVAERMREVGQP